MYFRDLYVGCPAASRTLSNHSNLSSKILLYGVDPVNKEHWKRKMVFTEWLFIHWLASEGGGHVELMGWEECSGKQQYSCSSMGEQSECHHPLKLFFFPQTAAHCLLPHPWLGIGGLSLFYANILTVEDAIYWWFHSQQNVRKGMDCRLWEKSFRRGWVVLGLFFHGAAHLYFESMYM